MAVFPNEEDVLLHDLDVEKNEGWKTNKNLQNYLRDNHSNKGGKYISDHSDKIGVPMNLIIPLHELMEAHNLSIHELDIQFHKRTVADNIEIDLKQLACILCIADALEVSDTRVVVGGLDELKNKTDYD